MTQKLNWRKLSARLAGARHLIALFDYDGTLAPFVGNPLRAHLPQAAVPLLRAISRRPKITLGFVSGRSMADLQKRVPFRGAYYIGNHGFEINGPGIKWRHPRLRRFEKPFQELARALEKALAPLPNILIEPKGMTISVHTRRASPAVRLKCEKEFAKTVKPWVRRGIVRVTGGKQVFEARPAIAWDKGRAVQRLAAALSRKLSSPPAILFVGDDLTDEDVFRLFRRHGITIRVGPSRQTTQAHAVVPSVRSVMRILRRVKEMP